MQYISLKIAGNPSANSGFGPLVSFNSPDFVLEDKYPVGFDAAPYVVSVKIEVTQVVYRIFINNVHSYGASRLGRLFIGISIPRGWRLTANRSPYDVLMAITDEFKRRCMRPIGSSWEYQNIPFPVDFSDFCCQFTIEQAAMPWHAMADNAPAGHVICPESDMALMLRDVQYSQFENYSEVYIATAGTPLTTEVTGLEIPRRPVYQVYANGVPVKTVRSEVERVVVAPANSEHYETETFTIAEVLANPMAYPQVKVDAAAERVDVTQRPRQKRFTVDFVPALEGLRKYPDQLRLYINNVQVPLNRDFSFTRSGSMITFTPEDVRAEYSGADYDVNGGVIVNGDCITVTGRKLEKKTPHVDVHDRFGNRPEKTAGAAGEKIKVVLPSEFKFAPDNHEHAIDVRLMRDLGCGTFVLIQQTYVHFYDESTERTSKNKTAKRYVGYMPVLAEWMSSMAFLEFTENGSTYATQQMSVSSLQSTVQTWRPSKLAPKTLGNDRQFVWAIVSFFAGVLLTLAGVWCWNHFFGGEEAPAQDADSEEVIVDQNAGAEDNGAGESGSGAVAQPDMLTAEQAKAFFDRSNAALANAALTFEQVEAFKAEFTNMKSKLSPELAQANKENIDRLNMYAKIVGLFRNADDASVEMLMDYAVRDLNKVPDAKLLDQKHFGSLHYLLSSRLKSDGKEAPLSDAERKKAAQYLKENAQKYNAFSDLPTYDTVYPAPKVVEKKQQKKVESNVPKKKVDTAKKER